MISQNDLGRETENAAEGRQADWVKSKKQGNLNTVIENPILPGFNPDPSICRVGEDYYIATSTFEWFPGVQIHHSKDLVNWRLLGHALNEERLFKS